MVIAILLSLPLFIFAIWTFYRFTPGHANRQSIARFNRVSVVVTFGLATAWSIRTYIVMSATEDSGWWPIISLLGAMFIIPFGLIVAAVIRNFIVNRRL